MDPKTVRLYIGPKQLKAVKCERFWCIRESGLEAIFTARIVTTHSPRNTIVAAHKRCT